jgi:hypothetical protein
MSRRVTWLRLSGFGCRASAVGLRASVPYAFHELVIPTGAGAPARVEWRNLLSACVATVPRAGGFLPRNKSCVRSAEGPAPGPVLVSFWVPPSPLGSSGIIELAGNSPQNPDVKELRGQNPDNKRLRTWQVAA